MHLSSRATDTTHLFYHVVFPDFIIHISHLIFLTDIPAAEYKMIQVEIEVRDVNQWGPDWGDGH